MIKRNIFKMFASAVMLLLACSCSSDQELDIAGGGSAATELPGTVRFSLSGSAASVATTAAPAETQNVDEKKVTSLYAVVFKDVTPAAAAGSASTEDANDTYFRCIDVFTAGKKLAENKYMFNVCGKKEELGDYQICFVANPSTGLLDKIQALTSTASKVSDFKALVEDQAPDTKPGMLMTSAFKAVKIAGATPVELGEVSMTRAMARIDVHNMAEGLTVTGIKFVNRAIKTNLYNDVGTAVAGHLEASASAKSYTVNLVGSKTLSETNKFEGQIYTYEQLETTTDLPSLEITFKYTVGTTSQDLKRTVVFAQNNIVALKRNHLYTVKLTSSGGKINFNVTVKDWVGNEIITVPDGDIASGAQFNDVAVGDFLLNDGTFVKSTDVLSPEQQQKAIGIVAYLFAPKRAGASLVKKLGRNPKGLVLALKNVETLGIWDIKGNSEIGTFQTTLASVYTNSNDGYDITQKVCAINTSEPKVFEAFDGVERYRAANPTPSFTTGWYMPSLGEWIDILDSNGLGKVDLKAIKENDVESNKRTEYTSSDVSGYLNAALNKLGQGNYDKFCNNSASEWYRSSSEYSNTNAYSVFFSDTNMHITHSGKTEQTKVRCVLAF